MNDYWQGLTCSLSFSVASSLSFSLSSADSVCGAMPLVVGFVSASSILSSLPSPGAAASPTTPPSAGIPSFFGVVVISTDLLLCLAPMFAFYLLVPPVFISLAFWMPGGVHLNRPVIRAKESIKILCSIFQNMTKSKTNIYSVQLRSIKLRSKGETESKSWYIRVRLGSAIWRSYTHRSAQRFRRG